VRHPGFECGSELPEVRIPHRRSRAGRTRQHGRAEAKKAVDEIVTIEPKFADDPRRFLNCFIFTDDLVDHVLDGLMKAGFRG
jgi:hypothetical protein